jgi:hypothetical protein
MREFLNKYGYYVIGGALVLALMLYLVTRGPSALNPMGDRSKGFFVDEETNDESVHSIDEIPPLMGKSGRPTVVRAMKFSCDNGRNPKTIYLLKYTPEAQEQLKAMQPDDLNRSNVMTKGELLRLPAPGSPWVSAESDEGAIVRTLPDCPDRRPIVMVSPGR